MSEKNLLTDNLDWLMSQEGLNPTSLSAAIGNKPDGKPVVPQATIWRIADGLIDSPRNSTLNPIARYFKVKVSDLWDHDFKKHGRPGTGAIGAHSLHQKQTLTEPSITNTDYNEKAKDIVRQLKELPFDKVSAAALLAIKSVITESERRAQAGFQDELDSETD